MLFVIPVVKVCEVLKHERQTLVNVFSIYTAPPPPGGFLRCSFSVVGIAKALNMERTKVRFPRFFIYSFHLTFIRLPGGSQGDTHRKIGHDSCGTAYRTYASRTGTHSYLVRRTVMLYTSQYIQDIQEGKYRHPSSLAHFVHTRS